MRNYPIGLTKIVAEISVKIDGLILSPSAPYIFNDAP